MSFLYTIAKPEAIFPPEPVNTQLVNMNGSFLEGMQGENGLQITRLISTDLKLYLDKRYAPGQNYKP